MTLAKKEIAKSVRLTQEVYDYILDAAGNGFNDKFENIILEAKRGESDREKQIAQLEKEIKRLQRKESLLFQEYDALSAFFRDFVHVQHSLEKLKSNIDIAAELDRKINEDKGE